MLPAWRRESVTAPAVGQAGAVNTRSDRASRVGWKAERITDPQAIPAPHRVWTDEEMLRCGSVMSPR